MSTILQREQNLIRAMKEQNYQPFFEGDAEDAYDTITSSMQSFVDYQNHVIHMSIVQPTIYILYEGQECRDRVQNLDTTRKIKHDAAIANMSMLNRICDGYGVEHIAPVDTKDRYAVADFIGKFCNEIYEENKSTKGPGAQLTREEEQQQAMQILDSHVSSRSMYPKETIRHRIDELDAKFGHIDGTTDDVEYEH